MKKKQLKILFVTHVTTLAGANRSMLQLIKELKEFYHVYIVVIGPDCNSNDVNIKTKLMEIGVSYLSAPIHFFKVLKPTKKEFLKHLKCLFDNRNYYKLLLNDHFDFVHSNSSVIDFGAYLSKKLKCKHVWHLREFGDIDYSYYPLGGSLYERFVYQNADAYIAISKAIKMHFQDKVHSGRIHMIYNGIVDVDSRYVAEHKNPIIEFFCAGVLYETKNQMEILYAIDELVNGRHISGFHLTLVGIPNRDYVKKMMEYMDEKQIQPYISILEETDGIKDIAKKMDVGIMCSHNEAFGRVTIEYMLYNLIVIANNRGANPELIRDKETGYIYEAGSPKDLADKMQVIISAKQFPLKIAEAGRLAAKENYLSVFNSQKIYQLYQSLL